MASTRFHLDPDRIFPDHAYAPGYEPAPRVPPPPEEEERVITGGEFVRFTFAALLMVVALAVLSGLMMAG